MASVFKAPRGTRAALNSKAGANTIVAGQIYLITDENRIAIGLSTNSYEVFAKYSEAGGGGGGAQQVFVQQTRPTEAGPWVWWQTDASGNIIDLTVNDGV